MNKNQSIKQSVVKIATVVWMVGLILIGFDLSVPPADVPLYAGLACIAIIPLIFGSRYYRVFGVIALICSLLLIFGEHKAGIIQKEKMERFQQNLATNLSPPNPQK